jgi:Fe-S-cluster formation regulator IscX/YfhJ
MRAKKTYLETIREEKKLRREKEALARAKKRAKELEANPQITGHRREMVALRRRLYKKGAKFLYEDGVLPRIVNTIEITKNVVDSETFKDNIFKTTETVLDSLLYTHIPPVLAEVLKKNGMFVLA